jgi:hypothetical protein
MGKSRLRPAPTIVGGEGKDSPPTRYLTLDPQFDLDPTLLGNEAFLHLSGLGTTEGPTDGPIDDLSVVDRPPVGPKVDPMFDQRLPPQIPKNQEPRPPVYQPTERPPQQDSAGFKGVSVDPRKVRDKIRGR